MMNGIIGVMSKVLNRLFPYWRIRNVAAFYVLSAVNNMWIVAAVWAFIWGRFMSKSQIGLSDSITFTVGFLVELPSGVFADVIGRKKAIVIGNILLSIGNFLISISSTFAGITFWYLLWTIGYAFQSGATEALVYDSLKKEGLEEQWDKIIAAASVISKTSTLTATAVGGFLFTVWFRLPYMVMGGVGIFGISASLMMYEVKLQNIKNAWSPKVYISQVKDGLLTLIRPNVFSIAILCLSITGIAYMYNWGILRPFTALRFGYTPSAYALLLSVISFSGIVAISLLHVFRNRFKLEQLLVAIGMGYAFLFFCMGFSHTWIVGGLIMILLSVFSVYIDILFSQFINIHTREEHRATTLSAVALFTRMPYVVLALLIGKLADNNMLQEYTVIVGIVAVCVCAASFILYKKQIIRTMVTS